MGHRLITDEIRVAYYEHVHRHAQGAHEPRWRGVRVIKFATDLILYAQAIWANRPNWIVETGTRFGGATLFFADLLDLVGLDGGVVSIDVEDWGVQPHSRITYRRGSSADPALVADVRGQISGRVMVVLDSDHSERHVRQELELWAPAVTPGQFLVVEDCYTRRVTPYHPARAVESFLERSPEFTRETPEDHCLFAVTRGGWLRKRGDARTPGG